MRRYPYHRYLTYLILNGDSKEDIVEHLIGLEYIPPKFDDIEELQNALLRRPVSNEIRKKHGVLMFDESSNSLDQALWLVETPPARATTERLLLDGVVAKHVATIVGIKYNTSINIKTIDVFRDGFWDTSVLTPVDFSAYFRMRGGTKPEPPPDSVSLVTRGAYSAWKQGLHPDDEDLSPDLMIREIRVDAFMRFKEMSSGDDADHRAAKSYAELVLKTAGANKALMDSRKGKMTNIPDLAPKLEYPSDVVASIGDLHSEYSEAVSGTGAESATAGAREEDGDQQA